MDSFVRDIGFDSLNIRKDEVEWKKSYRDKLVPEMLSESELDRIYRLLRGVTCGSYDTECRRENDSEEGRVYYRDVVVPLVHVRLFVVPSLMEESASSFINDRSLEYLADVLSDRRRYHKYAHAALSHDLMESMMDMLEAVSKKSIHNGRVHSLVKVMLPFVGYYCVMNTYKCWRYVSFLETYLSEDGPVRLWSAVLLCLSMNGHASMNVLREYLESESGNGERISDDAVIVYAAAMQSVPSHGNDPTTSPIIAWILTDMDYKMIIKMRECDPALFDVRSTLVDNIFTTFIHLCKRNTRLSSKKSSECQKMAIKCLCVSLPLLRDDSDADRRIMLTFLKDVRPYVTKSVTLTRMTETILYKLCQSNNDDLNKVNQEIQEICHKYSVMENISEEIKLHSSELICLTASSLTSTYDNGPIVSYISGVIRKMKLRGRETHFGFSISQLENTLAQLKEFTPNIPQSLTANWKIIFRGHLGPDLDKNNFTFLLGSFDSEIGNKFEISFKNGLLNSRECHSGLWRPEIPMTTVVTSQHEDFLIVVLRKGSSNFEVFFDDEYLTEYELEGSTLNATIKGGVKFDEVQYQKGDFFNGS